MSRKKKSLIVFLCILAAAPLCLLAFTYYSVTRDAAVRIKRGAIERVIASESPVYYSDGKTPIGVFFEKTHRKYTPYEDIPKTFVKAIVAAEDKNFFHHWGFDLKAMLRAMIVNLKSGDIVQGGSTITQQTAKNIFRREERSYWAKFKELVQAFLLERRYSKEEILEMYANQFFVTGYGKGLGIAAQYFFGKEPRDLTLVESAFIAGCVKAPNRYNPFVKKTEAEKKRARHLALLRKNYVLKNMYELEFITRRAYREGKQKPVPFREGRITYRLNVILDYVREQLQSDYFMNILRRQGVDNVATSGISIHTSVDQEVQQAALESLRRHLPLLDIQLNGYDTEQMTRRYQELVGKGLNKSRSGIPFLSRITHVDEGEKGGHLVVSWEGGGGIIEYDGLEPVADAWIKWQEGKWATFQEQDLPKFLELFHTGDLVPVRFKALSQGEGRKRLLLSSIPGLEGGVVVIQNGMVKAMVGGFFNRFFNRAVDAKRQVGSIFKPLLYSAALELKWNTLDPLPNRRDIYQFESTYYIPRPDHEPGSERVSLAWAGVKSENLATVWLLYHLTDHLNLREFRRIVDIVGLGKEEDETYTGYKRRIRDQHGVVVDQESLRRAAFETAKEATESDIIFGGYGEALDSVRRLHYRIDRESLELESLKRRDILRYDFQRLWDLKQNLERRYREIASLLPAYQPGRTPFIRRELVNLLEGFYRTEHDRIVYTPEPELALPPAPLRVTPEWLKQHRRSNPEESIWIDNLVPVRVLEMIEENLKENLRQLIRHKRYDPRVLYQIRDFRTLVNLSYVVYASKRLGISSELDPVLSFPLGPNSVSLMEVALAYQSIMNGKAPSLNGEAPPRRAPVITKIVDREGDILWEYEPRCRNVLTQRISALICEILRKVVQTGTGSKAEGGVRVRFSENDRSVSAPIPAFGKTGTANRFTNSSFVGFVPAPESSTGKLSLKNGYVVAAYVGYDDNRPMKGRHTAIYGSSGALPLWIDTTNAVVNSPDYKEALQPAELAFGTSNPVPGTGGLEPVPISPVTGLPRSDPPGAGSEIQAPVLLGDAKRTDETWMLHRHFEPQGGAP